jgi:hypothetical protein
MCCTHEQFSRVSEVAAAGMYHVPLLDVLVAGSSGTVRVQGLP